MTARWDFGCKPLNERCSLETEDVVNRAATIVLRSTGEAVVRNRFSPDGRFLVAGCAFGVLAVYDVTSSKLRSLALFSKNDEAILNCLTDLTWDATGKFVFCTSTDGLARCVDVAQLPGVSEQGSPRPLRGDRAVVGIVEHHSKFARAPRQVNEASERCASTAVAVPDLANQIFVTGGCDGLIRSWDMRRFEFLADVQAHDGMVTSLEPCGDNSTMLSAGVDGSARFWDLRFLEPLKSFSGCDGAPLAHAFMLPGESTFVTIPAATKKSRVHSISSSSEKWNLAFDDTHQSDVATSPLELQFPVRKPFEESNGIPFDGSTVVEYLQAPGPFVYGDACDDFLFVPDAPLTFQDRLSRVNKVHIWNSARRTYVDGLEDATKSLSGVTGNITSVSSRQLSQGWILLAESRWRSVDNLILTALTKDAR